MKIVTHDSSFHTDDILSVAALLMKFPNSEVVRSRNEEVLSTADILVDVGMEYDPSKKKFDHHQIGGAGERENGVPYASFGLVWKEYGEELSGGKRQAELIDKKLAMPIDAHDNGVPLVLEYNFDRVREYALGDFFHSFLSGDTADKEKLNRVFMQNVLLAKELLAREIVRAKEYIRGEIEVEKIYENSRDKRIIELPDSTLPWKEVLGRFPEPLYAIYPRPDGDWGLGCVPDIDKIYGSQRKALPESWGGKVKDELKKVTGVAGAKFAHRALFMASAKTKEDVRELAQIALSA